MDETPQGQTGQGDAPAQDSQQAPEQDSGLQTPQPDQPVPTPQTEGGNPDPAQAAPPVEAAPDASQEAPPVEQGPDDTAPPSDPAAPRNVDQNAAAAEREAAREAQQSEHARRTGGGDVRQGEIAEARDEHNDRVGGGVPVQEASGDGVHDSQPDE